MITRFMTEETYSGIQKAMRDYKIERAKALYKAGYSIKEISEILGISETEVRMLRSE